MFIDSLRIYSDAVEISAKVATLAEAWPEFHKRTLGSQIVRAADSVANNICEGYGRVSTGERVQFSCMQIAQ